MVYEQGMRVRGVDPSAPSPEIKPPLDDRSAEALVRLETAVPASGPQV